MLGRTDNAPNGQRSLRIEEVAVGPARLDAGALPGPVAKLSSDRMRGRRFEPDVEIDRAPTLNRNDLDVGVGDQRRRDQSTTKIVDLGTLELVSALEARNRGEVPGAERRLSADADDTKTRNRAGIDRQNEGSQMGLVIDLDVLLAKLRACKSLFAQLARGDTPRK